MPDAGRHDRARRGEYQTLISGARPDQRAFAPACVSFLPLWRIILKDQVADQPVGIAL